MEKIEIERGTRQGYPLSPLLYIIVLEILLKSIREDDGIKGVVIGGGRYKIKAFADNVIITTEDPLNSIPKALEKIKEYGKLAGFKINYIKINMMVRNLEIEEKENLQKITGVEIKK